MADQAAVWRALGRVAQRQHLARVDALLREVDRLSSLDGFELLAKFPLEFRDGDKDWPRVLLFLKDYVPEDRVVASVALQLQDDGFHLTVHYGDYTTLETNLSVEQVLLSWQTAVNTVASYPPPAL